MMEEFNLEKRKKEGDELINRVLRYLSRPISGILIKYTSLKPNQVTLFSLLLLILAGSLLFSGDYTNRIIGGLLGFAYVVFDFVDGEIARAKNITSDFGKWLDGLIGLVCTPLLILIIAINLHNYVALLIGAFAMLAYPMQFVLVYGFKVEITKNVKKIELPIKGRFEIIRYLYGLSLFYVLLPIAMIINKPLWLLIFYATFGNFFWIAIGTFQLRQLKAKQKKRG